MRLFDFMSLKIPLLLVAVGGVCLASSGRTSSSLPAFRSLEEFAWTVADFDGDSQPDLALTSTKGRHGYVLQLDLSTKREDGLPQRTAFPALPSSIFGLHLTPRDVDGDHDLDIVITAGFARQPVAVWINDGKGQFEAGDLAAYSTWIWREDFSISPKRSLPAAPLFADQIRQSQFDHESGRLTAPILNSGRQSFKRLESPICHSPADQRPARAPPLSLRS